MSRSKGIHCLYGAHTDLCHDMRDQIQKKTLYIVNEQHTIWIKYIHFNPSYYRARDIRVYDVVLHVYATWKYRNKNNNSSSSYKITRKSTQSASCLSFSGAPAHSRSLPLHLLMLRHSTTTNYCSHRCIYVSASLCWIPFTRSFYSTENEPV